MDRHIALIVIQFVIFFIFLAWKNRQPAAPRLPAPNLNQQHTAPSTLHSNHQSARHEITPANIGPKASSAPSGGGNSRTKHKSGSKSRSGSSSSGQPPPPLLQHNNHQNQNHDIYYNNNQQIKLQKHYYCVRKKHAL